MKQFIGLLVLALLAVGLAPGVFADSNSTNSTNETEIEPMHLAAGAEVRPA